MRKEGYLQRFAFDGYRGADFRRNAVRQASSGYVALGIQDDLFVSITIQAHNRGNNISGGKGMWVANPRPGNLVPNSIVSIFLDDGFRYRFKCIVTKLGGASVTLKVDGIFADDDGTEVRGGDVCSRYLNQTITVPVAVVWPAEATFATVSGL